MIWVFVFGGIALVGLIMVVSYAVWLVHKASDVFSEVTVLTDRAGQLVDLLGQIRMPDSTERPDHSTLDHSTLDHSTLDGRAQAVTGRSDVG